MTLKGKHGEAYDGPRAIISPNERLLCWVYVHRFAGTLQMAFYRINDLAGLVLESTIGLLPGDNAELVCQIESEKHERQGKRV